MTHEKSLRDTSPQSAAAPAETVVGIALPEAGDTPDGVFLNHRERQDTELHRYREFDSLTLASHINSLPLHDATVDAAECGSRLHEMLDRDPDLPGVVVTQGGWLMGMISRDFFFELLGRPFGVEVYMNRSVRAMLDALDHPPLVLEDNTPISRATRAALERPGTAAYEAAVVRTHDGQYRLLNIRVLILAQSRLLALSHSEIRNQLEEAAEFVHSMLPSPISSECVECDWRFVPSEQLGGDAFGYHWLDEEHLALYLLDVSGHGTGPAFLSVSALNILQNRSGVSDIDFKKPEQVLTRLNQMFLGIRKRKKGRMFITIWYGVYNRKSRSLVFASAGHPPAALMSADGSMVRNLRTPSLALGIHKEAAYGSDHVQVQKGDRLFVFSDGVYEVMTRENRLWTIEEFRAVLSRYVKNALDDLGWIEQEIRRQSIVPKLPDDFSLLGLCFH